MAQRFGNSDIHFNKDFDEVDADGVLVINKRNREQAKYPDFYHPGIQVTNYLH